MLVKCENSPPRSPRSPINYWRINPRDLAFTHKLGMHLLAATSNFYGVGNLQDTAMNSNSLLSLHLQAKEAFQVCIKVPSILGLPSSALRF